MSKKNFIVFSLILALFLPLLVFISWPNQETYLIACDVGQGDALLIVQGFNQILIDGGPNDRVLDCLSENIPFWDREIELVINTHPDKDHVAGLVEVLERYQINQVLAHKLDTQSDISSQFYMLLENYSIPLYSPKKGEKIKLGDLEFKVLWPSEKVLGEMSEGKSKTNESSIVLWLKHNSFDALLTGDITSREEKEIVNDLIKNSSFKEEKIEVLKVAHHGSKYSSSEEFLKAVKPEVGIISVGKNSFGHPTKEVLERLENIGGRVLRTDRDEIKLRI